MRRLVERTFDIRPEEFGRVQSFFALLVGVGMFYTLGATVGDTLFLSNLSGDQVPRMLPWVYVGIAVANVLSVIAIDALQDRIRRGALIVGTQVVLAVSVFAARWLVELEMAWVYFALAIWLEVCALVSVTLFFSLAGDYFTSRDARRLYGYIAGGMAVGTVTSGTLINLTVGWLGTKNLLQLGGGVLLLNAALSAFIVRRQPRVRDDAEHTEGREQQVPLKNLYSRPYVRRLAVIIPLALSLAVVVDYQMKWIASSMPERELARFFGTFYSWVGAAQVLFQFLLVPRLLSHLGIINCLMILPLAMAIASAMLVGDSMVGLTGLSVLFWSAAVNSLRMTLSETLDLPSRELLLLPLPTRVRLRLQPLMSGVLAPSAQGVAGGAMLLIFTLGMDVENLSSIVVLGSLMLVLALVQLRPRYRDTLAATLREHQLDATDLEQVMNSPNVEPLIEDLLRSDDADVVKSTFQLLEDRPLGALAHTVKELAASPDPGVAVHALQRLAADRDEAHRATIEHAWDSEHPAIRQAAVLALCELAGELALQQVSLRLSSQDQAMRESAMIGLARHCGEQGRDLVRPGLEDRARSRDSAQRTEAAELLGRISIVGYADLMQPLLEDADGSVRSASVLACAELGDPDLLPTLLANRGDTELRPAVMRALSAMPADAIDPIVELVTRAEEPVAERRALTRVLARVGGRRAMKALWQLVDDGEDLALRLSAAESLLSCTQQHHGLMVELLDFDGRVDRVCGNLQLLTDARAALGDGCFAGVVFRDHARLHVELALSLLSLRYDAAAIQQVRVNLLDSSAATRGRSVELIDEILPRRSASRVVPALQGWAGGGAAQGTGLDEELRGRVFAAGSWPRVTAAYHLAEGAAYPQVPGLQLRDAETELYRQLEMVKFLKEVPLFAEVEAYHLLDQARIAHFTTCEKNDTLFSEGDAGDALYIICDGEISVRIGDREVARLSKGECLGDLALLDGEARSASCVATTHSWLLQVDAERFRGLLMTQPAITQAMLRTLDRRIRETQNQGAQHAPEEPHMRRSVFMRAQKLGIQQLVSTMSFLRQVDLFRELSTPAMANLAGIAQEVVVYEGDTLFEQGDVGESLYLICTGGISVSVNEREVARLERNACLGEMALISGLPRSASATATNEGRLLRIGSDDFMNLLATEPEIGLALLKTLARRLRAASVKG